MAALTFIVDKSTFSANEVGTHPSWATAFWLAVDGFTYAQVLAAGTPSVVGNGPFASPGNITLFPHAGIPQDSALTTPQRVLFPFDVDFVPVTSAAIFPTSSESPIFVTITAKFSVAGEPPLTATTEFMLTGNQDPYFLNINPGENKYYLSQDLRVFSVTPTINPFPPTSKLAFNALLPQNAAQLDTAAGYSFIEGLLYDLNLYYSDASPGAVDPFDSVFPDQSDAFTSFSSVIPTATVTTAGVTNVYPVYNFAVARVRLNGDSGTSVNTRVFFRAFTSASNDTDYDPTTTYISNPVSTTDSNPGSPLTGAGGPVDPVTLPFFATGNYDDDSGQDNVGVQQDYTTPGANNQKITIPTGKNAVWAYFGVYLNVYDPYATYNGVPVESLLNGGHHCLVAQIASDDAPIETVNNTTLSPENCDKLAQRNTNWTPVPVAQVGNRSLNVNIPQTLDLRASNADQDKELPPDELLIDWGQTPIGSTATLYWPQVSASTVIALADELYDTHQITAADANTLQFTVVNGLTYVPIPFGTNVRFAGLFNVQIPPGSIAQPQVEIVVRRITNQPSPGRIVRGKKPWRYITGTFDIRAPTLAPAAILPGEETLLAITKYRLSVKAPSDRWYPVLSRYVTLISDRVNALGGNAAAIPPSPKGYNPPVGNDNTGKVTGLIYDRFGDFEGFHLLTEEGKEEEFWSKEKNIEHLIRFAWEKRAIITVKHHHHHHTHRPTAIILRRLPAHSP